MKSYFKSLKYETLAAGLISIAIGLLFVLLPEASQTIICHIAGGAFIVIAILSFVSYITSGFIFGSYSLVAAIVFLIAGIFCFARPETVQKLFSLIIGAFLIIDGVISFSDGTEIAKTKSPVCIVLFVFAVASIVFGCMILFGDYGTMMVLVGVFLMINGLFDLIVTLFFSARIRRAQHRFKRKMSEAYERSSDKVIDSTATEKAEN